MGGHEIYRAAMVSEQALRERDRIMLQRQQLKEAKAAKAGQISEVTWFGGIKATARFLTDSAREAVSQRRMTEAQS
jgi:hypothetical protein